MIVSSKSGGGGGGSQKPLTKLKMDKYESMPTYGGEMMGGEEECPLTYLLNGDLYLFVRSIGSIKDGSFAKCVESQGSLFRGDYK